MKLIGYNEFLSEIKERILSAQYDALREVNKELVNLYWDIGKRIIEQQEKHGWGKSIIETLALDLQKEYPGIKGFSSRNLWKMRNFSLMLRVKPKLQPLVAEISWVKNILIMEKCKNYTEKEFYINMTKKFGWSKNVLAHQIESKSYERYLLNQTNFDNTLPSKYKNQAKLAVKDEYTFDFLELGENHLEKELEKGLINSVKEFLSEMGGYFCFIGSQYRIEINGQEFFIDLLLYHRMLKCLVAIEIKTGEFIPEYMGKMQFYLSVLDDKVKMKDENPSMGILICRSKNKTIVEYALKDSKKPIGVSTYKIMKDLPKNISKYLPSRKEIEKSIKVG